MIQTDVEQLLKPVIEDMGYVLWGCEYLGQGKHSLLRIYIDKESGIGIEDCERVSKQVSALLDVDDPIPGNYTLEVSSPGIPRPLFQPWQYQQYIGENVDLKLFKPIAGKRKLSGTLLSADDETVLLKQGEDELEIQFSNVVKANLTV